MAAVRAGACGMGRSPKITLFSSTDWSRREARSPQPRKGKGYGISATTAEAAHNVWKQRRIMLQLKLKLCDCTVLLSLCGLILIMIDVEISASYPRETHYYSTVMVISFCLRVLALILTVLLLFALVAYHFTDTKIYLIETGSQNWRIALTRDRITKLLLELGICSICPFPEMGTVEWPLLSIPQERIVLPTHVLFCLPMFLRLYLLCRYIVLHSRHYRDCATRTIAKLNHVSVDFRFVVRSQLYDRPLFMLGITSISFWFVVSWMITQCERFTFPSLSGYQHFADYLWFHIITFFSIGYGDIQVQTYCGRGLAMLTAIVGTLFSSTLIALVGRKMALSSSEKRVNHLVAENQLSREHKHAAARVLQNTWRTVLRRRELDKARSGGGIRLAAAQRGLLRAVLTFRKTRWRLRMQMEDEDDYFTARRAFMETDDRLQRVRVRQQQLDGRLSQLFDQVQLLTDIVHSTQTCYSQRPC